MQPVLRVPGDVEGDEGTAGGCGITSLEKGFPGEITWAFSGTFS